MENVSKLVHKVRQAPWRAQRQWIGAFFAGVIVLAMVTSVYLIITVRATVAGRELQALLNPSLHISDDPVKFPNSITANKRINAELETQLAALNSIETMRARAEAMGFQPASIDDMTYVSVPGYVEPSAVDMSTQVTSQAAIPVILPEYTESWFDYFLNAQASSSSTGAQP